MSQIITIRDVDDGNDDKNGNKITEKQNGNQKYLKKSRKRSENEIKVKKAEKGINRNEINHDEGENGSGKKSNVSITRTVDQSERKKQRKC